MPEHRGKGYGQPRASRTPRGTEPGLCLPSATLSGAVHPDPRGDTQGCGGVVTHPRCQTAPDFAGAARVATGFRPGPRGTAGLRGRAVPARWAPGAAPGSCRWNPPGSAAAVKLSLFAHGRVYREKRPAGVRGDTDTGCQGLCCPPPGTQPPDRRGGAAGQAGPHAGPSRGHGRRKR